MALSKIIMSVQLKDHRSTGLTRHYRNGVLIEKPASLKIVQFDGDPGYYLIYLNSSGDELTDTYHDTLEKAQKQAELEYDVKPEEWEISGI